MLSLEHQNTLRQKYQQAHPDWRPATEVFADLVRQHLRPDSLVLDLGCGRGGLLEQLGHPLNKATGIDPDIHSLKEHRLPLPRAAALSHQLPFASSSFDLIFASWLLEHLELPALSFQAISRVLRSGGFFVFITPNRRHPLSLINRSLGRFARVQGQVVHRLYGRADTDSFPTYYRANTAKDLRRLCQQHALHLELMQTIPDPTYLAFTPALFRLMCWIENRLPGGRHVHLVGAIRSIR